MKKTSDSKKRVLILGNSHLVVFNFRKELIERLVSEYYEVWTCFPKGPFGEGETTAKAMGCHFIENHIERRGTNPFHDMAIIAEYFKIMCRVKPDVVLAYTVKPDVYGGIVCRILGIPFIPNITGLGKGLVEGGMIQKLTVMLYKWAVKKAKCVFFQNSSDKEFFDRNQIKYKRAIILPGSGVNLQEYTPLDYPADDEPVRFIYIARVMKAKGIEQYFDAANVIKSKYPETEFHICGYCEEDYKDVLDEKVAKGDVIYHGLVSDVRSYETFCHCVVLPSFHPEGISNVLLEGAACGRPLITTDRAGCRETIFDGVTGFLVREQDSVDLITKIEKFLSLENSKRKSMGLAGRQKIEREYDRQIVVDAYMKEIEKI